MPTSISCPFCNATFPPEELWSPGPKTVCPRCGEPYPGHLLASLELPSSPHPVAKPRTVGWTNRKVGLAVVSAMALMAALGLALALSTVDWRRKNDYRTKRDAVPPAGVRAPGDLAGLGYLPPEVNVAMAIQVAELYKDAGGGTLLEAPRPALLDLLLGAVEKWTKLKAADVDHIVVGTEIKDKLPQLTLVVETRRSHDPATLAKALYPLVPEQERGKPLYRFALQPGEGMLWCPQPQILVLLFRLDGLKRQDLEAIPLYPRQGSEAPPRALQALLAPPARVSKNSLIWLAGRLEKPELVKELLNFVYLPPADVRFLTNLSGFGVSLFSQDGLVMVGHFQFTDKQAAERALKQLEEVRLDNLKSTVAVDPQGQWITWQLRGPTGAMRDVVAQWGKR